MIQSYDVNCLRGLQTRKQKELFLEGLRSSLTFTSNSGLLAAGNEAWGEKTYSFLDILQRGVGSGDIDWVEITGTILEKNNSKHLNKGLMLVYPISEMSFSVPGSCVSR